MSHSYIHNTNNLQNERLLTAEDVAEQLNICPAFAYRLMQRGEIPVVRLGRAVRVRPQDLQAYIEANLHQQVDL